MKVTKIVTGLIVVVVTAVGFASYASASTQSVPPPYITSALTSGSFSYPTAIPATSVLWSVRNNRVANGYRPEVKLAINYNTISPYYVSEVAGWLRIGDPSQSNERNFVTAMLKHIPGWPSSASGRIENASALGHWLIVRVSLY
jgi:hypothetical protein